MINSSANLREKFKHLLAISRMSVEEKVRYLDDIEISPSADRSGIWCSIALKIAQDCGRLPDHLHNRFLMEVGSDDLKRAYLDLGED